MEKNDGKLDALQSIADSLARIVRVMEEESANGIGMSLAIIAKALRDSSLTVSVDLVAEAIRKATGQELQAETTGPSELAGEATGELQAKTTPGASPKSMSKMDKRLAALDPELARVLTRGQGEGEGEP